MKKVFLAISLLMMTVTMMAIPAKRGMWRTITLADGTEVKVEKVGDEHGHWLRAADGTCYVLADGNYVKADDEALQIKRQARLNARNAVRRKAIYASTSDGLGEKGTMSRGAVPSIGEYTIPVVMVQFSDLKFKSTTTVDKMNRYYNEVGYHDETGCKGSVRDYFKDQSGGQFIPTFDVVGIVTLDKSYKYYGKNVGGSDQGLDELPRDVIDAAVSQLGTDFSQYVVPAGDAYHSTGVPLLAMFYAGKGEATEAATTENSYFLWPCEWDDAEDPIGRGTYQGVHFNSFFIGNELFGNRLMGMSVFCHEFGHAMGLPDFYCTAQQPYSGDDPFGLWSIMDSGAYMDDYCRIAPPYTAYEKSYMGWLELKELGTTGSVTLQAPDGLAENSAYIVRHSSTETFILENRQPGTWQPSKYGSGVLVSRIAYSRSYWESNTVNYTQSQKRACVLTADDAKLDYSASSANLYGNNGKTSIDVLKTLNRSSKTIGITKITKNNDRTITLTLTGEDPDPDPDPTPTPTPTPDGAIFYESFNQCDGTGGNDGKWSGNIAMSNTKFHTDNDGWQVTDNRAYGGNQCAKFGASTVSGEATTPTFTLVGSGVLTFRASAWDSVKDGITLNLSATGGTLTPSSVEMTKGNFDDFTVQLTGTGEMTITFASAKGRFFMDEVLVKADTADGIESCPTPNPSPVREGRIYTIDGRFAGTDLRQLPRGMYIVGGKKVVK